MFLKNNRKQKFVLKIIKIKNLFFEAFLLMCVTASVFFSDFVLHPVRASDNPTSQKIGSWNLICNKENATDLNLCQLQQLVEVSDQPEIFARIILFRTVDQKDVILRIFVPMKVELIPGILLSLDGKKLGAVPYRKCDGVFCFSESILSKEMLLSLESAKNLTLYLYFTPEQPVPLDVHLEGLLKAYELIKL